MRISQEPMSLEEVIAVARGAQLELTDEAISIIERSRRIVDTAVQVGEAIYGVTTGVGHARDERISPDALEAMQPLLVEMHVGAMGPPFITELVRAGMVIRLNGFTRGGAGVSLGVVQTLEAMLNHGIHPIIPRSGSVGSGDLGQLALLGRAMMGRGEVEWNGKVVSAAQALQGAGLAPVTLQPKDALGIISSNALTIGHGIVVAHEVEHLLTMADLVAAMSMETIAANPSFFDETVAAVRSSQGQIVTSASLRTALAGSSRVNAATAASVQDPLSFRVVPQVHGACRDMLTRIAGDLFDELNAPSDNPLVDLESERILSNGNFHAMNVALSAESLNLALAHVGLLSERRSGHLWDAAVTSLGSASGPTSEGPPPLEGPTPPFLAGLSLRYPSAARYSRLRQLAQPVTLDVPPLDLAVEDHSTNAAEALWVTEEIVDAVTDLLVVECLLAVARLFIEPAQGSLGARTTKLIEVVGMTFSDLSPGASPHDTHERVRTALIDQLDLIIED